jgi:hypothetical protein
LISSSRGLIVAISEDEKLTESYSGQSTIISERGLELGPRFIFVTLAEGAGWR